MDPHCSPGLKVGANPAGGRGAGEPWESPVPRECPSCELLWDGHIHLCDILMRNSARVKASRYVPGKNHYFQ